MSPHRESGGASRGVEILHHARGERQSLIVEKQGGELRLRILSDDSSEWQSRMDLQEPSRLVAPYLQAMTLALLWCPQPSRVHLLGLGGGRFAGFLRRLDRLLQIDATEIDRDIYDLAVRFFGFRPDPRMRVIIGDGREFLAARSAGTGYDAIFLDAFCGIGGSPLRLSSREFFAICREQLTPQGVVAINMMPSDALKQERLGTVERSFPSAYVYEGEGAVIAFGSNAGWIGMEELLHRAVAWQTQHQIEFSLPSMARSLRRIGWNSAPPITDTTPAGRLRIPEALLRSVRPEDPCPCGSGETLERCHGSAGP